MPLDFHLTQVGGQWRIDHAPNGIVLTPAVFQKFYRPHAAAVLRPDLDTPRAGPALVPGVVVQRHVAPSTRSIVDELIAGPVGAVGSGVTSNALAGATVEGDRPVRAPTSRR